MPHLVETPNKNDVISGRGNFVSTGNENFRNRVKSYKLDYVTCPKSQKGKYATMIYEEIKNLDPPGRFLRQDKITQMWNDIGETKAIEKIRQALREGAPDIKMCITGDYDQELHRPLQGEPLPAKPTLQYQVPADATPPPIAATTEGILHCYPIPMQHEESALKSNVVQINKLDVIHFRQGDVDGAANPAPFAGNANVPVVPSADQTAPTLTPPTRPKPLTTNSRQPSMDISEIFGATRRRSSALERSMLSMNISDFLTDDELGDVYDTLDFMELSEKASGDVRDSFERKIAEDSSVKENFKKKFADDSSSNDASMTLSQAIDLAFSDSIANMSISD